MLAHNVYFSLHQPTEANRAKLIAAMKTYLNNHPGLVFFACGVLTPDLARPVNDRGFDVALHTVFATRADHDAYQVAPRHLQFIAENKADWAQVRVFDSDVESA
ncbi:Dabb family protein [Tundrisphaera sp. TA3]|uniref:Dabb family protein n=1 Tax=Tundrisphaera sp. TA3 TaxID=3435775 RepID=UPI003EBD70DA